MLISNYIVVFCLVAVIILNVYLQYALGVMKASVRTACILPISYAIVMPLLIVAVAGITANSALLIVGQLIVAYWLFWLYEWGTKHPQQVRPSKKSETSSMTLSLKKRS